MSRCKILFDECLHAALAQGLRRRSPLASILQVGERAAPPKRTSDPSLLVWCENDRRIFVSGDRATLPDYVAEHCNLGRHTFGVLIVRPGKSFSDLIDDLYMIVEVSEAEEWIDRLDWIPAYF